MESTEKNFESITPTHLKNIDLQIRTCLDYIENNPQVPTFVEWDKVDVVDFYMPQKEALEKGFLKDDELSYIISDINDRDKMSMEYKSCTGLVVSGIEKDTGQAISFITHQNPGFILNPGPILHNEKDRLSEFKTELSKRLREFKSKCEEKTIDAVLFGGQLLKFKDLSDEDPRQEYLSNQYKGLISIVTNIVKNELDFIPEIVTGPKTEKGSEIGLYDTSERRLYLYRNNQSGNFTQSFPASRVDEKYLEWKPGEVTIEQYLGKKKN